jgi:hypothetical protein
MGDAGERHPQDVGLQDLFRRGPWRIGKRAFERRYRVSFAREVKRRNAEWRELAA